MIMPWEVLLKKLKSSLLGAILIFGQQFPNISSSIWRILPFNLKSCTSTHHGNSSDHLG